MSLANLTTSGWVFLAWTLFMALCFVARIARRASRTEVADSAALTAISLAWLLWLVQP